jgi:hypothetical protein
MIRRGDVLWVQLSMHMFEFASVDAFVKMHQCPNCSVAETTFRSRHDSGC